MQGVTAAVTPKGVRRQYALVSAAAELLCEGGFDAVRHRAVARRAGLPLAATTYYFSSLDDLIVKAVEHIDALESQQLREVQRRILQQRTDAVVKVVERCGRSLRAELVPALVCAVDGAVVAALVDDGRGPRNAARVTLIDVIDVLAPITAPISAPVLTAASG